MRTALSLVLLSVLLFSCSANKSTVIIPPNQYVEIDYPEYDAFRATLNNKGKGDLDVAVFSKKYNRQVKGFGLGRMGTERILVEAENKLVLKNTCNSPMAIKLEIQEANRIKEAQNGSSVNFTLRNTSAKSIPLLIPSVMNPNLSPFSRSGVNLAYGQEILFKERGKKYNLLTVDASIQNGDEIDVAKLLKNRKQELGIK